MPRKKKKGKGTKSVHSIKNTEKEGGHAEQGPEESRKRNLINPKMQKQLGMQRVGKSVEGITVRVQGDYNGFS